MSKSKACNDTEKDRCYNRIQEAVQRYDSKGVPKGNRRSKIHIRFVTNILTKASPSTQVLRGPSNVTRWSKHILMTSARRADRTSFTKYFHPSSGVSVFGRLFCLRRICLINFMHGDHPLGLQGREIRTWGAHPHHGSTMGAGIFKFELVDISFSIHVRVAGRFPVGLKR